MRIEERTKEVTTKQDYKIYIANDGTEFTTEEECQKYDDSAECNQFRNQEQTLLWTLYSILDKLAIEGEARDIAIRDFKEQLINKDLY